ncbi:TPA: peptide-binding protein [Enterobacter hormaechei subsp. xiangfangensis]
MTTLNDTQRPDENYLAVVLANALTGRSEDQFINDYLSGVARCLASEPRYYRSFGPWWASLKQMLVEKGGAGVGVEVDSDIAGVYGYERKALTAIAGYLYQQDRLAHGLLFASTHQLPVPESVDDEPYEFVSYDLDLESRVTSNG